MEKLLFSFDDECELVEKTFLSDDSGAVETQTFVRKANAVLVVAVDDSRRVLLIRRKRALTGEVLLELPGGRIEKHEKPEEAAQRELFEETGVVAVSLTFLGSFWSLPSITSERANVFLTKVDAMSQQTKKTGDSVFFMPLADLSADWAIKNVSYATDLAALMVAREMVLNLK